MATRPGTMLYFDVFEDLEDYNDEEVGQLFRALLHYGLTGEIPSFADRGMKTMWRKLQSKMDRDAVAYDAAVTQRQYAAYCKKTKKAGDEPLSYEDWLKGSITTDNGPLNSYNGNNQLSTVTATINHQLEQLTENATSALAGAGKGAGRLGGEGENPSARQLSAEQQFENDRRNAINRLIGYEIGREYFSR